MGTCAGPDSARDPRYPVAWWFARLVGEGVLIGLAGTVVSVVWQAITPFHWTGWP